MPENLNLQDVSEVMKSIFLHWEEGEILSVCRSLYAAAEYKDQRFFARNAAENGSGGGAFAWGGTSRA